MPDLSQTSTPTKEDTNMIDDSTSSAIADGMRLRPAAVWILDEEEVLGLLSLDDRRADMWGKWEEDEHDTSDGRSRDIVVYLNNGQAIGMCLTLELPQVEPTPPQPRLVLQSDE